MMSMLFCRGFRVVSLIREQALYLYPRRPSVVVLLFGFVLDIFLSSVVCIITIGSFTTRINVSMLSFSYPLSEQYAEKTKPTSSRHGFDRSPFLGIHFIADTLDYNVYTGKAIDPILAEDMTRRTVTARRVQVQIMSHPGNELAWCISDSSNCARALLISSCMNSSSSTRASFFASAGLESTRRKSSMDNRVLFFPGARAV